MAHEIPLEIIGDQVYVPAEYFDRILTAFEQIILEEDKAVAKSRQDKFLDYIENYRSLRISSIPLEISLTNNKQ